MKASAKYAVPRMRQFLDEKFGSLLDTKLIQRVFQEKINDLRLFWQESCDKSRQCIKHQLHARFIPTVKQKVYDFIKISKGQYTVANHFQSALQDFVAVETNSEICNLERFLFTEVVQETYDKYLGKNVDLLQDEET